ncbi:hypothetical protein ACFOET_17335 [Parapedobacter deserti]|uniref:Outer membrane protein beta-barrel domain-containing protein n=1 Tax=Parapedobacter deserti TaxID=1912957 RepID=A0ABV7JSY6_9SPHI
MKICYIVALCCIALWPYSIYAQHESESPIPYFRYSATAGLGATQLHGDLDRRIIGPAVYLKGNYFLTHGISIGLELQEGLLLGKDEQEIDGILRQTVNLYHAAVLGVTFQPIKYLQDDHLRRIEYRQSFGRRTLNSVYVGAGAGVLYSMQWERSSKTVQRTSPAHEGRDHGLSYILSTNFGFEIPLHSLKPNLLDSYIWSLVVNGQLNFSLDDDLDGYSGTYPGNENRDSYGLFSVGVNLRF